jgi:FKBP-type peptidyl-prolyl cis-trans isomerase FklB
MIKRLLLICICVVLAACGTLAGSKDKIKTDVDKVSYGIGVDIGGKLSAQFKDLKLGLLVQGLKDSFNEAEPLVTEEEFIEAFTRYQKILENQQVTADEADSDSNLAKGEKFLKANAKEKGIEIMDNSVQYKVLTKGKGAKPVETDKVLVNYRGTLIDGTEFDSSYKRGQPAEFPVGGVIPGMSEALKQMTVGSKWMLYIPSEQAYGARRAGKDIGPNSTLIFELELLEIK